MRAPVCIIPVGGFVVVGPEFSTRRGKFFVQVFGRNGGYLCLGKKDPNTGRFEEEFFQYPDHLDDALFWIDGEVPSYDLYFCAQLLTSKKRKKEYIKEVPVLWADLDPCPPDKLHVPPSIVIETSPNRYQAIWRLEEPIDAFDGEELSHRIAYWHKADGVDSGWALTKYLRVPFTYNFKYGPPHPVVTIPRAKPGYYRVEDFKAYDAIPGDVPGSANGSVPITVATGAEVLERNRFRLSDRAVLLFTQEPDESTKEGWSGALWALIMECAEAGLSLEDIFVVARDSACNKYERDGRPVIALWKEVQKAFNKVAATAAALNIATPKPSSLINADYKQPDSFVARYIRWAKQQTDAASIYHQAGAFMILSSALSGMMVVPTSDRREGEKLNLWFFILANTTITRKTTAMNMAIKLVREVYPEAVAATEATIEGLFTTMASRPGKPSIFLRDEFAGMLEMMQRKDYYAGMAELLTQLYDGYEQKRQLAKATVTITDPLLLMFVGGARDKILDLLNENYFTSGFMPRFLFFTGDADLKNYRPLGPPTNSSEELRDQLSLELQAIVAKYQVMESQPFGESTLPAKQRIWKAHLTDEAWARYNTLELTLVHDGEASRQKNLVTPVYLRLGKSILKAAVLLAACRPENPDDTKIIVTAADIEHAISYGIGWRNSAIDVLASAGGTPYETQLKKVMNLIQSKALHGIARSTIMRIFSLSARDADGIFMTLEGRTLVRKVKQGGEWMYFATGV